MLRTLLKFSLSFRLRVDNSSVLKMDLISVSYSLLTCKTMKSSCTIETKFFDYVKEETMLHLEFTLYLLGTGGYLPNCFDWYPSFHHFNDLTLFWSFFYFFTANQKDGFSRQNEITLCSLCGTTKKTGVKTVQGNPRESCLVIILL